MIHTHPRVPSLGQHITVVYRDGSTRTGHLTKIMNPGGHMGVDLDHVWTGYMPNPEGMYHSSGGRRGEYPNDVMGWIENPSKPDLTDLVSDEPLEDWELELLGEEY